MVHENASAVAKSAYNLLLKTEVGKGDNTVLFTGGGTGAGKTSGLKALGKTDYPIIYDSNISNPISTGLRIDAALAGGYKADIVYTYNDIFSSLDNALNRAEKMRGTLGSGRTVPLKNHIESHINSPEAILELAQKYAGDKRVSIRVIDNSGNVPKLSSDPLAFIRSKVYNKDTYGQLKKQLEEQINRRFAEGRISEGTRTGFLREQGSGGIKKTERTGKGGVGGGISSKLEEVSHGSITSFRGNPVSKIADTTPYYSTTRAKGFVNELQKTATSYGVTLKEIRRVAGSWEGSIEPSFDVQIIGSLENKLAYMSKNASRANQDAFILFTKGKGTGTRYIFDSVKDPDFALSVLHKEGISGATVSGNKIIIYDADGGLVKPINNLIQRLKITPEVTKGDMQLVFKEDYNKVPTWLLKRTDSTRIFSNPGVSLCNSQHPCAYTL